MSDSKEEDGNRNPQNTTLASINDVIIELWYFCVVYSFLLYLYYCILYIMNTSLILLYVHVHTSYIHFIDLIENGKRQKIVKKYIVENNTNWVFICLSIIIIVHLYINATLYTYGIYYFNLTVIIWTKCCLDVEIKCD